MARKNTRSSKAHLWIACVNTRPWFFPLWHTALKSLRQIGLFVLFDRTPRSDLLGITKRQERG